MVIKRLSAFILVLILLVSGGVVPSFAENINDAYKGLRRVGIHAQADGEVNPEQISKIYMGEDANIYLAVDAPNKGNKSGDKRLESHFDLNGYSMKLYYDEAFFALNADNASSPVNYKIPSDYADITKEEQGKKVPVLPGYYVHEHHSETVELPEYPGRKYRMSYITVLFNGTWLPDNEEQWTDGKWVEGQAEKWYNLCAIPVRPLKTGTTEVFIEYETDDEYSLELYSKNNPDEDRKNFELDVINSGFHTIEIGNQPKPAAPVVTPASGPYPVKQLITITAAENCDIYYSINGGVEELYYEPFEITSNTELVCYAKMKTGDMRESNRVSRKYIISPEMPYLFKSDEQTLIPNAYDNETRSYKVLFSDTADEFRDIPEGTEIYYTFREDIEPNAPIVEADKPENGWVKVEKRLPELTVDKALCLRMFTDNKGSFSAVNTYYLGISPDAVEAKDKNGVNVIESGVYNEPLEIGLFTQTPGAEIYYTINGSSPVEEGTLFDASLPIVITKDTILRAVAKVDGKFGPVMTNWYVIRTEQKDFGVEAFYPSGKYEGEVIVTLMPSNPEYTVQYKFKGDTEWTTYDKKKQLIIKDDEEITARAVDNDGNTDGSEHQFIYKIMPKPPIFSTESTRFTNSSYITLYCGERTNSNSDKYSLYYTTDGSWPITTDGGEPRLTDSAVQADPDSDSVEILIDEYTVVTAVIMKDGKHFSTVVQHSYNVVKQGPVAPITTLVPGTYFCENENPQKFSTLFLPVSAGTEIYYTVSYYGEEYCPDPVANTDKNGTIHYNKLDPQPIEVRGDTTIKAVAVDRNGLKSDIGIFSYTVVPETPFAPPGGMIAGTKLPVVPVTVVPGSEVSYKIGDFENSFECENGKFYLDTSTGTAYADAELTQKLGTPGTQAGAESALFEIVAKLDGVTSETGYYHYAVTGDANDTTTLAAPYADKRSGRYDEIDIDGNNNLLIVKLDSINNDAYIEYKFSDEGEWKLYNEDEPVKIADGDVVLQARCFKGEGENKILSQVVNYTYFFYPIPPKITLESGRYAKEPISQTRILLDKVAKPHRPYDKYRIWYRRNGDPIDYPINSDNESFFIDIEHTMSLKAYVENTKTKRISSSTVNYYVVEEEFSSVGTVEMEDPYRGKKRIASQLITVQPYSSGIRLFTDSDVSGVKIYYSYKRTYTNGKWDETDSILYDSAAPIAVTGDTASIEIEAWLVDKNGVVANSVRKFEPINFVSFDPPKPSLENEGKIQFDSGKSYTIINDYPNDPLMSIYYTIDGKTEPVTYNSSTGEPKINGTLYNGETLSLKEDTTIKTVYRSSCGTCYSCDKKDYMNCRNVVFGNIGTYRYVVKEVKVVGGGGGGGRGGSSVINTSRKYTVDIFGNEHPTHIGYINGYPDGSVRPDGNITREEISAILYRIKNKAYDAPFATSGDVFPDVKIDRWSVKEIEYMEKYGVVEGYPDGEFKPSDKLTRAEFAAMICRFAGLEDKSADNPFPDFSDEHWAYSYILRLYSNGLISGYEDGTFRPEREITRAEVMTVVNKLLGRKPLEPYVKSLDFNPFNDLKIEKWYYVAVMEATITHNYYLDKEEKFENLWEDWK